MFTGSCPTLGLETFTELLPLNAHECESFFAVKLSANFGLVVLEVYVSVAPLPAIVLGLLFSRPHLASSERVGHGPRRWLRSMGCVCLLPTLVGRP